MKHAVKVIVFSLSGQAEQKELYKKNKYWLKIILLYIIQMLIIQNFYSNNISHIQWIYAMMVWYLHYEYKKVFITEKYKHSDFQLVRSK